MSILNDIYTGLYESYYRPSEDYQKLSREHDELLQKAVEILGPDFADELLQKETALTDQEIRESFRAGFRLGAGLMAELL